MKDAYGTKEDGIADDTGDMAPKAADPDLLTIDLVRKVMEKTNPPTEPAGGLSPTRRTVEQAKMAIARDQRDTIDRSTDAPASFLRRVAARLFAPVRAYRPTSLHLRLVTVALIFVINPWLIPITAAVVLLIAAMTYFTLGPDRILELAVTGHERIARHNPKLAEALRQYWQSRVPILKVWAGYLPEQWTEDLFAQDETPSEELQIKMKVDPFDRLASETRKL